MDYSFVMSVACLAISVAVLGWAAFKYCKAGMQMHFALMQSDPEKGKSMKSRAEKSFLATSFGLLLVLALFVILYALQNDLRHVAPSIDFLNTKVAGQVICGDTSKNPCTIGHLGQVVLTLLCQ